MLSQLLQILGENSDIESSQGAPIRGPWDASSAVLITYADGIFSSGKPSLKSLKNLLDNYLSDFVPTVHILPFLCSTSDGGFAVSDYELIDPRFGSWDDLKNIALNYNLMADVVINHVSASHPWVNQFKNADEPGARYILSPPLDQNWEKVVRPRNSSLFTSIETNLSKKEVWTTFGSDQIDLNWKEPDLLIEFLLLIVRYLKHGITWIRLDAIGFIWKEPSTTCLHLEQVHDLVKILRILINKIKEKSILITETNVPQKENISYLKSSDEAHLAYNFTLPPLLLDALINNKADLINDWICSWPDLPVNTGFLNFTASHDGIGLRALEGLMHPKRIHDLLIACEKRGGLVSHRRMPSGEDVPYELNISWWSAMSDIGVDRSYLQFERFILSQLFIMGLKGVPAFYLQALMASENDLQTFIRTGERRDLNRERFDEDGLNHILQNPSSKASENIKVLSHAMAVRRSLKAFHPEEPMKCLSKGRSDIVIIARGKGDYKVWAVHNMTKQKLSFSLPDNIYTDSKLGYYWMDILHENIYSEKHIELNPYAVYWLIYRK